MGGPFSNRRGLHTGKTVSSYDARSPGGLSRPNAEFNNTDLNGKPAVRTIISGRAWASGTTPLMVDPGVPFPNG